MNYETIASTILNDVVMKEITINYKSFKDQQNILKAIKRILEESLPN